MLLFNEQKRRVITYFIKHKENNLAKKDINLLICNPTVQLHVKQMTIKSKAFYKICRNYESIFEIRLTSFQFTLHPSS